MITTDFSNRVFGLPRASYTAEQATAWVDPVPKPRIIPRRRLLEAPYWDIAMTLSVADLEHLDPDDCYLQALAERPPGTIHYEVHSKSHSSTSYLQKTFSGLTGTRQSYSLAEDTKDSNLGRPNARLRIELEAQRNEFTSLQKHNITLKKNRLRPAL